MDRLKKKSDFCPGHWPIYQNFIKNIIICSCRLLCSKWSPAREEVSMYFQEKRFFSPRIQRCYSCAPELLRGIPCRLCSSQNSCFQDHGYTENPMEREDVEESVKVESVKGTCHLEGWEPVLRIHDILVWIRIRIRESMPLTNGSGYGSGVPPIFVTKQQESRFFLLFLHSDRKIWSRIQEAQKHTDPTDPISDSNPDPQHWWERRCLSQFSQKSRNVTNANFFC